MHSWSIGSKRTLDEEEWETLRPAIQLHYIEENKTFAEVARILKQKYGFEPTKKQFTTRMEKWGMKKNISRSERMKLLQSENSNRDVCINDLRLSATKLANWRKRYKYEASRINNSTNQQSDFDIIPRNEAATTMMDLNGEYISQSTAAEVTMKSPVLEHFDSATISGYETTEIEILNSPNHNHVPMEFDSWPFDWTSIDVTGPTGLAKLFRGLEIECAHSTSQSTSDTQSPDEPICISNTELQSLWNSENHSRVGEMNYISNSWQQRATRNSPQHMRNSFSKDPDAVFFGYMESPYNELYVFPVPREAATTKLASPRLTLLVELEAKESDLQRKLRVLKRSLPSHHPVTIATMEKLASVYYDRHKSKKAEILFRQVVTASLKAPGTPPLQILATCMRVAQTLYQMSQYQQAQDLFQKIIRQLQQLVTPEHELMTHALHGLGVIAMALKNFKQAEDLLSHVLQINLSLRGPRHHASLRSMGFLGNLLERMNRSAESEKLLRALQKLYSEIRGVEEIDICEAMCSFSWSLYGQQLYEEGEIVARQTLERVERTIGTGHLTTIFAQISLGANLRKLGRIPEAKELFQKAYRQSHEILGCKHSLTLDAALRLAIVQSQDQMEEAMRLYKEIFHVRVDINGLASRKTRNSCRDLGRSYEVLGLNESAVKLYKDFVEKLGKEDGKEDPDIARFESRIEWNLKRIREREDGMKKDKDKIIGDES